MDSASGPALCSGLTLAFLQPTNDQISSTCTRWQVRFRSAASW